MGRRGRPTAVGLIVALVLNLCVLFFYFVVLSGGHPGGCQGALAESVIRALGLHESQFTSLSPTCRDILWLSGKGGKMTLHRVSYFHAVKSVILHSQSRYKGFWQQAQSWWLEREVEYFLGARCYVQYVSTGSSALVVALQALGVGLGDEVIVPTYTWVATAAAGVTLGAIPIMVDIDETLGLDPRSVLAAITPRTKAIIAVHMRGVPCDIVEIARIAAERNLHLVEDVAQAFGASVGGKMLGTFGAAGITSVNPSKTFHAGGQGGLVWTMDRKIAERVGWSVENGLAVWGGVRKLPSYRRSFGSEVQEKEEAEEEEEVIPYAGHCFRAPSEWHAAFLRSELQLLPAETAWLRKLKSAFTWALRPEYHEFLQRVADPSGDRSYTVTLLLRCAAEVPLLQAFLSDRGQVITDKDFWEQHFLPHVQGLMKKVSFHSSGFPWLTEEDQRPLDLSSFNKSTGILSRSLTIEISSYYSPQMMEFAANVANEGLAMVLQAGVCSDR